MRRLASITTICNTARSTVVLNGRSTNCLGLLDSMILGLKIYGIRNETHLLYASSYARAMSAEFQTVLLEDADRQQDCGARNVSWFARFGPQLELVDRLPTGLNRVDRVYIGSPSIRRLFDRERPRHPGRSIVVDEGLGSYGSAHTRFDALRREGASAPVAFVRAAVRSMAMANTSVQRWPTYEATEDGWHLNDLVAETFRAAADPPTQSDRVILLTQPWTDLGLADDTRVRAIVHDIAAAVANVGLTLTIRAHPAETRTNYRGLATISSDRPAEVHSAVGGARLVIGETSSALLHLSAMFGLRAIRLTGLSDPVRLSPSQQQLLDQFLGPSVPLPNLADAIARTTARP